MKEKMPDYPRVGGASASEVWAYATRRVTNLDDVRAAKIDNVDVVLSTRSSHVAGDVWTVATRAITDKAGFTLGAHAYPFTNPASAIDLPNVQAGISPTATGREAKIDKLDDVPYFETPVEGSLLMSGVEQVLVEKTDDKSGLIEGMINLTPMAAGDTVVVREYMQVLATGAYAKYAEETYSDAQTIPLLQTLTRISTHDVKVTIQQTAGTYRTFEYSFVRRREA